jgi:hypothetical protein
MVSLQSISDKVTEKQRQEAAFSLRGRCGPASEMLAQELDDKGIDAQIESGFCKGGEHHWVSVHKGAQRIIVDPTAEQFGLRNGVVYRTDLYDPLPGDWARLLSGRRAYKQWKRYKSAAKKGTPAYREAGEVAREIRFDSSGEEYFYRQWECSIPATGEEKIRAAVVYENQKSWGVSVTLQSRYVDPEQEIDVFKCRSGRYMRPENGAILTRDGNGGWIPGHHPRVAEALEEAEQAM